MDEGLFQGWAQNEHMPPKQAESWRIHTHWILQYLATNLGLPSSLAIAFINGVAVQLAVNGCRSVLLLSPSEEQRQIWIPNPQLISVISSVGVQIHHLPKFPHAVLPIAPSTLS